MNPRHRHIWVACCLALTLAGCRYEDGYEGSFERTLTVTGRVRLELKNASGDVDITSGEPGEVRIRGEYRIRGWSFGGQRRRVEDLKDHPPIEQHGNFIRVGEQRESLRNISIRYTVVVPAETEVRASTGSGDLRLTGVRGPVKLSTGSGDVTAEDLGADAALSTGSGDILLRNLQGRVETSTRSGDIHIQQAKGDVRASTGSGNVRVEDVGGRLTTETGSGDIEVDGIGADLRMTAGSGSLTVRGNPARSTFWELDTGSGDIELEVPPNASFRLYARARSREIDTGLPMVIEEESRRELRARIGQGEGRVEVRTSSGTIRIH